MLCYNAYNVTNRIFRCFITNNVTAILIVYIAYARPHLEFASTVWDTGIESRGYLNANLKKLKSTLLVVILNTPTIHI